MISFNNGLTSAFESEKIYKTCDRRKLNTELYQAPTRILIGSIISLLVFVDMYINHQGYYSSSASVFLIWCAELMVLIAFVSFTLKWMIAYTSQLLFPTSVVVTRMEQSLLGIKENELGFKLSPDAVETKASTPVLKYSPSSFHSTSGVVYQSATNLSASPLLRPGSVNMSREGSMHSSYLAGNSSYSYHHDSKLLNGSSLMSTSFGNCIGSSQSPVRKRMSFGNSVTTLKQLDTFLAEEAGKEQAEQVIQNELGMTATGYSFWGTNRTISDYIPVLKKFQYQVASRTNQLGTGGTTKTTEADKISKYPPHLVWSKLNISEASLDIWIENFRYWVGQTIFQRLASEITKVNRELRSLGSEDCIVGEASLSTLKNLALVKCSLLPTLNNVVPYLEVSSHQEYLVHRIKILGDDGCIAEFNWDGGESYGGKEWKMTLPTDSAIVMHLFCTYLDARIPANPKYPEGKSFSSLHFIQTPDKPNFTSRKDYLAIYQTNISPPHYKLVVGEDIIDLPKGRNNMFYVILLFLIHVRDKESGMIGHVSFGRSGVNLLWILSEKYGH